MENSTSLYVRSSTLVSPLISNVGELQTEIYQDIFAY